MLTVRYTIKNIDLVTIEYIPFSNNNTTIFYLNIDRYFIVVTTLNNILKFYPNQNHQIPFFNEHNGMGEKKDDSNEYTSNSFIIFL